MDMLKFKPEGWKNEITKIESEYILDYIENGNIFQGLVKKCDNDYNLHIQLNDRLTGIIPRNEVEGINIGQEGIIKTDLCTGKVHKFVQFKIKDIKDENIVTLSRKDVQTEAFNWFKNEDLVGQKVQGIVKNIKPYGVFIEIAGGVVGMLHVEDISVARIKNPAERFKIGQIVDVVVKSICDEKNQILLSHKEILGSWEENIVKYKQGVKVKGIVRETEKNKNGIFIELEPNLVGLAEYEEGFCYGDSVNVYIRKIDNIKKKIKLLIITK